MPSLMKRTFLAGTSLVLAATLSFAPVAGTPQNAQAAESDDLNAQADQLAASAAAKQAEADTIARNVDSLQTQLNDAQARYDQASSDHDTAKAAADDAKQRVDAAKQRTSELQDRLGERATSMYKQGGPMSFINVLLGASSFDDFLTNWDALQAIADQDAQLIQEAKDVRAEAEAAQTEYEAQSQKAASEMDAAQQAKTEIANTKASMESELSKITEDIAVLQGQEDTVRESAEAAKQREAAAAAAAAAYSQSNNISDYAGGSSSGSSWSGDSSSITYPTGGGGSSVLDGWVNPCPSYYGVTCEWGYSPITGSHSGIDLGASEGDPIYAAGPGTVTYVGWYGTGGNAVIISHGNGMRTIYMHQSATAATVGQEVNAGDLIGFVGTTGLSTGPHLHFTIEINGSSVNPRTYYNF